MRFKPKKYKDDGYWRHWFAWYPVKKNCDFHGSSCPIGTWFWLEKVSRKRFLELESNKLTRFYMEINEVRSCNKKILSKV